MAPGVKQQQAGFDQLHYANFQNAQHQGQESLKFGHPLFQASNHLQDDFKMSAETGRNQQSLVIPLRCHCFVIILNYTANFLMIIYLFR